jgi:hypothetical protein
METGYQHLRSNLINFFKPGSISEKRNENMVAKIILFIMTIDSFIKNHNINLNSGFHARD